MLILTYPLRQSLLIAGTALLLALAACTGIPPPNDPVAAVDVVARSNSSTEIKLEEPRSQEVVIIINNNSALGNHAGLFVGSRLSDPAGSFVAERSRLPGWTVPLLADYVEFQKLDGPKIQLFRFTLAAADVAALEARLPEADRAAPLFCAAAVQNAIAGIGPFQAIKPAFFTTPAGLAEVLRPLSKGNSQVAGGRCAWADGAAC